MTLNCSTIGHSLVSVPASMTRDSFAFARNQIENIEWDRFDVSARQPLAAGRIASIRETKESIEAVISIYENTEKNVPNYLLHEEWSRDDLFSYGDMQSACLAMSPVEISRGDDFKHLRDHTDSVQEFEVQGTRRIFRPLWGDHEAARLSLVAAGLDFFMGFDTVPSAWIVSLEGALGVMTEFCEGERADFLINSDQSYDRDNIDLSVLFQFLIDNDDVYPQNARLSTEKKMKVFDFDCAFFEKFFLSPSKTGFGMHLPVRYSDAMLESLIRFQLPAIKKLSIYPFLHENEIEMLMFRRDVLLVHGAK